MQHSVFIVQIVVFDMWLWLLADTLFGLYIKQQSWFIYTCISPTDPLLQIHLNIQELWPVHHEHKLPTCLIAQATSENEGA